jgi:hypothetical protein
MESHVVSRKFDFPEWPMEQQMQMTVYTDEKTNQ